MGTQITPVDEPSYSTISRVVATGETVSKGHVLTYTSSFDPDAATPVMEVELIDVDESVKTAVGVALEDAAAGEQVRIVVSGEAQVLVDGTAAVAIGDPLIASAGTAGELILHAAANATEPTFAEAAATSDKIVPLEAQAATSGTLTWCLVACR